MTHKKGKEKIKEESRQFNWKQPRKWPLFYQIVIPIGGVIFLIIVFFVFYNIKFRNAILPKTYLGNQNFGGKSKAQANELLGQMIKNTEGPEIQLSFQDKNWNIKKTDLNLTYNQEETLNILFGVGRRGGFKKVLAEQFKGVFSRNKELSSCDFDEGSLDDYILKIADEVDITEKDASLEISGGDIRVKEESLGQKMDLFGLKNQISENIGEVRADIKISLKVDQVKPKILARDTQEAKSQAQKLLENNLTLKGDKKSFELKSADIAPYLEFVGSLKNNANDQTSSSGKLKTKGDESASFTLKVIINPAKMADYISSLSSDIFQEAKDPKFGVQNGKVQIFQLSEVGYELDQKKARTAVSQAILKSQKEISLPVKVTKPKITSSDPAKAGLVELVGEGETSWNGSPQNRIHNIELGASKISGTLVAPGKEFSTLEALGEIGPTTGFLPELVIKNSTQVVPDYGGGLCQVSTTLFRAVLSSGLKVTARTPHSFRVSYYEPPVGEDATIFDPAPDFKFINDMKTPILIWAIAGNNSLSFQFYGTKDGRKVEISDPVLYDYTSPPDPVYTESATMATGEIRQVERALSGAKASFDYKVTAADGSELEKETFKSDYVALPNSYLYGPGTQIPPPENP